MGGGREKGELGFNGYRVSLWIEEECSGDDGGDGKTTVLYLMCLNWSLKYS